MPEDTWGYLKDGSAAPIDEKIYAGARERYGDDYPQLWREYKKEYEREHGAVLYEKRLRPSVKEQEKKEQEPARRVGGTRREVYEV